MWLSFTGFSYNCCYFKVWAYVCSHSWGWVSHKSSVHWHIVWFRLICFLFLLISTKWNWYVDCCLEYIIYSADLQASPDVSSAAIHEFRIPPKALVGLHSYCPVYFDTLHAVLIDVSVHVSLLKAASHSSTSRLPRFVKCSYFQFKYARFFILALFVHPKIVSE